MNAHILSIETATPPHVISQKEIAAKMIDLLSIENPTKELLQRIYDNSCISKRHSVLDDFSSNPQMGFFLKKTGAESNPCTRQRNEIYLQQAPLLAHEAASKAIKAWGGDPSEITHVLSVSCTGVAAPGLEFLLIQSLNLNRSVHRLGINFMGCFGAFKGLQVASAFARENSDHRILVVCTELCSLHFQKDLSIHNIVGNSIFSDGAAACIVGCKKRGKEKPVFSVVEQQSIALDDSLDKITWEVGNNGLFMKLSPQVPILIKTNIQKIIDPLIGKHTTVSECDWPIHPGGKSILEAIEKKLELNKNQTAASWETLSNHGNMSSATFLFVLDQLRAQKTRKKWAVGLGFGPGLSIEGVLLHQHE